jgi:hypothetical protein
VTYNSDANEENDLMDFFGMIPRRGRTYIYVFGLLQGPRAVKEGSAIGLFGLFGLFGFARLFIGSLVFDDMYINSSFPI